MTNHEDTRAPVERCPICDWPFAESAEKGCVPGDCSYRPDEPAEQERIRKRRADLARAPVVSSQAGEERPKCRLCGLEEGACICAHVSPEPCDKEILRLLRDRSDDRLSQRAANLIEWAMFARSPSPAPGGMGDLVDSELAAYFEKQCNRYVNGQCMTLRCQRRGYDYQRGAIPDYARASCEEHEAAVLTRTATQSAEVRERTIEEWYPAKTAPKDGKPFLAFFPDGDFTPETGVGVIWWEPSEQRFLIGDSPIIWKFSHWRSLPVPPLPLAQAGVKL